MNLFSWLINLWSKPVPEPAPETPVWPPSDPATVLACTAWMEARSGGKDGMQSVLNVVMNRAKHGGWWGDTPVAVCLKLYQFSSWNEGSTQIPLVRAALTNGDASYAVALRLADLALKSILPDLTYGADSYYDTCISPPTWTLKAIFTVEIAGQRFFRTV